MHGLHLTADLHDCCCDASWLIEAPQLQNACLQAAQEAGLQVVNQLFHRFPATPQGPGGVTATLLLAESHVCLHTWPELQAVTLDVYVCNLGGDHSAKAERLMEQLLQLFRPRRTALHRLQRGSLTAPAS
ncbi:MAG: adenosylmethionine decarboxylase [Burkholderiaceae bacterium]|nr:adenosylmethionine decarboxylase [Burkholderiaceae bacterium]